MLPENMAIDIMDVLVYNQRRGRFSVNERGFSALTLRMSSGGKYMFDGKTAEFTPGSVCLVPQGLAYERITEDEQIYVIHFKMLNFVSNGVLVFKVQETEEYKRLFEKALDIWNEKAAGCKYHASSVLYELLGMLSGEPGTGNFASTYITDAAEYMKKNFSDSSLSVDFLTRRANVSSALFRRSFNRVYGVSPKKYLDSLRIEYAISLLSTGYFTQEEIAARCGYSDVKYFRTAFKNKTGSCISRYKNYEF